MKETEIHPSHCSEGGLPPSRLASVSREVSLFAAGVRALGDVLEQSARFMRLYQTQAGHFRRQLLSGEVARQYREQTGRRAPGSARTKRLRKKRGTAMFEHFWDLGSAVAESLGDEMKGD